MHKLAQSIMLQFLFYHKHSQKQQQKQSKTKRMNIKLFAHCKACISSRLPIDFSPRLNLCLSLSLLPSPFFAPLFYFNFSTSAVSISCFSFFFPVFAKQRVSQSEALFKPRAALSLVAGFSLPCVQRKTPLFERPATGENPNSRIKAFRTEMVNRARLCMRKGGK